MGVKELKQPQRKRPQRLEDIEGWIHHREGWEMDKSTETAKQLGYSVQATAKGKTQVLAGSGATAKGLSASKISFCRTKLIATMMKARSKHRARRPHQAPAPHRGRGLREPPICSALPKDTDLGFQKGPSGEREGKINPSLWWFPVPAQGNQTALQYHRDTKLPLTASLEHPGPLLQAVPSRSTRYCPKHQG